MKMHNPDNERIKRRYFNFLTHAHGFSEASIDAVAKAIHRFEAYTQFRSIRDFHIEQAFRAMAPSAVSGSAKFLASSVNRPTAIPS